jgi:hypothetical protein
MFGPDPETAAIWVGGVSERVLNGLFPSEEVKVYPVFTFTKVSCIGFIKDRYRSFTKEYVVIAITENKKPCIAATIHLELEDCFTIESVIRVPGVKRTNNINK